MAALVFAVNRGPVIAPHQLRIDVQSAARSGPRRVAEDTESARTGCPGRRIDRDILRNKSHGSVREIEICPVGMLAAEREACANIGGSSAQIVVIDAAAHVGRAARLDAGEAILHVRVPHPAAADGSARGVPPGPNRRHAKDRVALAEHHLLAGAIGDLSQTNALAIVVADPEAFHVRIGPGNDVIALREPAEPAHVIRARLLIRRAKVDRQVRLEYCVRLGTWTAVVGMSPAGYVLVTSIEPSA